MAGRRKIKRADAHTGNHPLLPDTLHATFAPLRQLDGYIIKPATANVVLITVANALQHLRFDLHLEAYKSGLEKKISERTGKLDAISDRTEGGSKGLGQISIATKRTPSGIEIRISDTIRKQFRIILDTALAFHIPLVKTTNLYPPRHAY